MLDKTETRYWMNVPAQIGNGADLERDFKIAVHLTLYWAQAMSSTILCNVAHPSRDIAEKLKGLPVADHEFIMPDNKLWKPRLDELDLVQLPKEMKRTQVKKDIVSWSLGPTSLWLEKETFNGSCIYIVTVDINLSDQAYIVQKTRTVGGRLPAPGVTRNLKLISSVCGLYDAGIRFLPKPTFIDTPEDVEQLLIAAENPRRQQPIVAVAEANFEKQSDWKRDVEKYARESFTLQHVVAVTKQGVPHLQEMFGTHGMRMGSIKTYNSGFSLMDIQKLHPVTNWETIQEHRSGRAGMLERWRKRLMTQYAFLRHDGNSSNYKRFDKDEF